MAERGLLVADPSAYTVHPLHAGGAVHHETNCYTDVLIELLHAAGCEPLAVLGTCIRSDFEADQWTFFKPAQADLERCFGIDVHEMQLYRPLPDHIAALLQRGMTMIVEVDAFHLPDTAGTSYGQAHVKTSIAIEALDRDAQTLRYFHNAGLYELGGEDYRELMRLGRSFSEDVLPPYAEVVRFDAGPRLEGEALRAAARASLAGHAALRPASNPFPRFGAQLAADLPALLDGDVQRYHDYAFATVRMVGAGYELLAAMAEWCWPDGGGAPASVPLRALVDQAKVLSFRLARRKPFDPEPLIAALAGHWDQAMSGVDALLD